jgi:hypothetical protein
VRPATTITVGILLLVLLVAATLQLVLKVGGGTPSRATTTTVAAIGARTSPTGPVISAVRSGVPA